MSRHVPPHRWADAIAGRIDAAERAAMDAHAETCRACSRARGRVGRASDTFPMIRAQAAPELPWDSVRARVHWSVSKERRAATPPPRSARLGLVWAGLATAAAATLAVVSGPVTLPHPLAAPDPAPIAIAPPLPGRTEHVTPPAAPPRQLAGLVNRVTGDDVMIDGARPTDLFTHRLVAGTVLATGDDRVDIQFGDASAFALGPRSTLELRRFDAEAIELAVEGTIDIEVAPRAAGQRFVVIAGEHAIEVRGTQFRVSHGGTTTTVACRHGLVAVRDRAHHTVEVGTARRVEVHPGQDLGAEHAVPLSVDELSTLAEATPMTLPLWNPDTLATSSAPLEITGAAKRDVRVDGIELGVAPLRVRVMLGRHTVEAADPAGRFRRAGWVDVAAPIAGARPARIDLPAEPVASAGIGARRQQLRAGIDQARLARCTRSIAKAGLTGTYVQIELSVDATGAVGFLNVLDTDLPSATAACVREVLADVRFTAGAAATWREKLDL